MYELKTKKTHVKVHAKIVDDITQGQIVQIANHPAVHGLIAIMPDTHAGAGCVIGFTGRFKDAVIPNVVGVDIGCGVSMIHLGKLFDLEQDLPAFDKFARKIVPLGFNDFSKGEWGSITDSQRFRALSQEAMKAVSDAQDVSERIHSKDKTKMKKDPFYQMGTLGGGNHFIEINVDSSGDHWLTVHSGSRNFGLRVANYHQKKAVEITKQMGITVPKGLEYLPMAAGGDQYIKDMEVAQSYARSNRETIIRNLLPFFGKTITDKGSVMVVSTHNYISEVDGIVRKGAIRSMMGELVAIPLDMASGIVLGYGKSNKDFNNSAPHGAGRLYGRGDMKRKLQAGIVTMAEFQDSMKNVFSTCVKAETIDESPFAYKKYEDIREELEETVQVEDILKPVYNLKG